jgi:hypothetical protein
MINNIWNIIANIGVSEQDSPEAIRWKRLQNQLYIVVFSLIFSFSLFGTILEPVSMFWRILIFIAFFAICLFLNKLNMFELSRALFSLAFIPLFFAPNWIFDLPVHFPFLAFNGLMAILLQYIMISHILPNQYGDKFEPIYIVVFLLIFSTDYFYYPHVLAYFHGTSPLFDDPWSFFFLKSVFAGVIIMELFTIKYVNALVGGLLKANKELDASIDAKIDMMMKKIDNR